MAGSLFALTLTSATAFAQPRETRAPRVLHFEALQLEWNDASDTAQIQHTPSSGSTAKANAARVRFGAYGRRFNLELSDNNKWPFAKARGATARAYRGRLTDRADSWVRLTQVGAATHGLIWDGEQLYAVAPAQDIDASATTNAPVIFRVADTVSDEVEFCGAQSTDTPATLYSALQSEAQHIAQAAMPDLPPQHLQLSLSILIDAAFRTQYASDAAAVNAVLVRLNNVDGIFSSQFGADIEVASIELADGDNSLGDSNDAVTLLKTLAARRGSRAHLAGTGVTHLFTGKDLSGSTVGLAYVDQVCNGYYGAALSESRQRGAWFDSLVVAHELGHSFGAPHDGEAQCENAPKNLLMSPYINGSDRFSHCSAAAVQARLSKASCLTPTQKADIAMTPNIAAGARTVDVEFQHSITISNRGGTAAQQIAVEVTIPAAVTVVDAYFNGGLGGVCSYGAGVVACSAATLAAHTDAVVTLSLRGAEVGAHAIQAAVTAFTDADPTNNSGSGEIVIEAASATATSPEPSVPQPATNANALTSAASGGGAFGWEILWLIAAAFLPRRRVSR